MKHLKILFAVTPAVILLTVIFILASAENKESIRKYQSYIFIDDISNCYMCGKYDKFSCNLSVEKSVCKDDANGMLHPAFAVTAATCR